MDRSGLIRGSRNGQNMATTMDVLGEEQSMIDFARNGRGKCRKLGSGEHRFKRVWLDDGQRRAVHHVLDSTDRVVLIRGRAGTGKTTLMEEAVEAIEANGKRVFTFAPSAGASRGVLRTDGFADADTVARLLLDENLQERARGQVVWVDEAGLLGSRQMARLFDLAKRIDARVILCGDPAQHASVDRGKVLRLLEQDAGLIPADIREIKRQSGEYRQAVSALSEGRTADGFRQLDRMGWIREVPHSDRYKLLAEDYVDAVSRGKTALVIAPTHIEKEWCSDEIRNTLKRNGQIGSGERRLNILENANLTEAERRDPVNYAPGDVLVYHQNAVGVTKGERMTVEDKPLPFAQAARFQVFHPDVLPVAPGDRLRITRNGKTADGRHRLNNGDIFAVRKFNDVGDIVLTNGWVISQDYGFLVHGFCTTSHAAQGKTVDEVFIGQSSQSFPASSQSQFY